MEASNAIGESIRRLRKARGLTLKDMSQRTGYSYQAVAAYEKGSRRVGVEQALRLAQALQCPIQEIWGGAADEALPAAGVISLYDLPERVAAAPCVDIRDPMAYVCSPMEADACDALARKSRSRQSLQAARHMDRLASSYASVLGLLDDCLGDGAGLVALRMLSAYSRLNGAGRERAMELLEDLAEIPRFEKQTY